MRGEQKRDTPEFDHEDLFDDEDPAAEDKRRRITRKSGQSVSGATVAGSDAIKDDDVPVLTRGAAGREFKTLVRHAGPSARDAPHLSYTKLLRALRGMTGTKYDALCFRYAVMGRPLCPTASPNAVLPSQALAQAENNDAEQMLCFMRCIDDQDEGTITQMSFCNALTSKGGGSLWEKLRLSVKIVRPEAAPRDRFGVGG